MINTMNLANQLDDELFLIKIVSFIKNICISPKSNKIPSYQYLYNKQFGHTFRAHHRTASYKRKRTFNRQDFEQSLTS